MAGRQARVTGQTQIETGLRGRQTNNARRRAAPPCVSQRRHEYCNHLDALIQALVPSRRKRHTDRSGLEQSLAHPTGQIGVTPSDRGESKLRRTGELALVHSPSVPPPPKSSVGDSAFLSRYSSHKSDGELRLGPPLQAASAPTGGIWPRRAAVDPQAHSNPRLETRSNLLTATDQ